MNKTTYINGLNKSVYETVDMKFDFYGCRETSKEYSYTDTGYSKEHKFGYGYNGEALDDTGLIYLRARYYNPRIGQFIQLDTYQGEQDSIESQNRYAYTMNNPYKYVDMDGNKSVKLKMNPSKLIGNVVKKNTNKTKPIVSTLTGKTMSGTVVNYLKEKQEEREKERIRQQFINAGIPADHPDLKFGVDLTYKIKKLCTLLFKPIKAQKEREQQLWEQNQKAQEWYNNSIFVSVGKGLVDSVTGIPQQLEDISNWVAAHNNNLPSMMTDLLKPYVDKLQTSEGREYLFNLMSGNQWKNKLNEVATYDYDLNKYAQSKGYKDIYEYAGNKIGDLLIAYLTVKGLDKLYASTTGGGVNTGTNTKPSNNSTSTGGYNTDSHIPPSFEGASGAGAKLVAPKYDTSKLQHEFKHASDFGIDGNWNSANGKAFKNALNNHVKTSDTILQSTYRGSDVVVYINKATGNGAYYDFSGNFIGGWKLSAEQLQFHIKNGVSLK